MISLQTTYLGLTLQSPIIVGSSGLTNYVKNIIEYEQLGVGAVVLKSLFEEQIQQEVNYTISQEEMMNQYPEALDYISNYSKSNRLEEYLNLIKECKESVSIPIIASVNCVSATAWMDYAVEIEKAGADAIELNVFVLPSNSKKTSAQIEKIYIDVLAGIKSRVKIPVVMKLSSYFSSFANMATQLVWGGADGLVFFNRFFSPDIELDTLKVKAAHMFSTPDEISHPMRWIAILSNELKCDIAASTGVHDTAGVIKMLLAGAKAVEIVSTLYKNGNSVIPIMLRGLQEFMEKNNYNHTSDFIGNLSYKNASNSAAIDRVQFMKHFSGIE